MLEVDPFIILNIGESLGKFGNAIMNPLYWAVSGILVGAHRLVSPLFGADSGATWTLSILGLTIVIRTLMMPLYAKQLNSSRAMQAIQPKIREIQEKYQNDRERLGQETMKLYQEEGVSPTSSCLPLLIQLPIFWALFRVLSNAARGKALGHFFEQNLDLVESLSNASVFNAQLSGTFLPITHFGATQILAMLLIIAMTSTLFFQQMHMMRRNMPPAALEGPFGQQQKMMLYLMPLMFVFAGLAMPIGVLIYWMISNLWTLIQQWFIIRNYPTPGTPAHIEWEERMIAKGKDPKEIERIRSNKGRKRPKPAVSPAPATDEQGRPKVARQKVTNRDTVRRDGKQVVQRRQVQRQPRSARKKKKS